jgi:hypothetical protein
MPADCADARLGLAAARLLLRDDPAQHEAMAASIVTLSRLSELGDLADGGGHRRPIYLPLVLHLNLQAFARRYESLTPALWSQCESAWPAAIEPLRVAEQFSDQPPPGAILDVVLWQALCLMQWGLAMSRDTDLEYLDSVVHQVVSRPGAGGSLHARQPRESLDAWTYRELAGLHALANLALLRRSAPWSRRVEQVALYHLENTQPDNTTNQPWGVFAFLWSSQTRSFAEQQLHDATTNAAGDVIAALLLADAAASLGQFG